MSQMQTAGRNQSSTMNNILIVSSIPEKGRQEKQNTYLMCADAVKCFNRLWPKECLIEMKELGYSSNDIKTLYEMYRKTDINSFSSLCLSGSIFRLSCQTAISPFRPIFRSVLLTTVLFLYLTF